MPRTKSLQPQYRFHLSGQARVEPGGKTYYLGKHGLPEFWAKYHELVGEYLINVLSMVLKKIPTAKVERREDELITSVTSSPPSGQGSCPGTRATRECGSGLRSVSTCLSSDMVTTCPATGVWRFRVLVIRESPCPSLGFGLSSHLDQF